MSAMGTYASTILHQEVWFNQVRTSINEMQRTGLTNFLCASCPCASQPHILPQDASTPMDQPAASQPLKGHPSSPSVESTCPEDEPALVERVPAAPSEGCSRAVQVETASAGTAPSSAEQGELGRCCNTTLSALPGGDAQLVKQARVKSGPYRQEA